jgi:hypothetical protein
MAENHPCDVVYRVGDINYTLKVTWGVMAAIHEIVGEGVATEDILKTHDPNRIARIFCAAATPQITVEELFKASPPFMEVVGAIDKAMAIGYIGSNIVKAIKGDEKNQPARAKKNTP